MSAHVCAPRLVYTRHVKECRSCGVRRRVVCGHAAWYDPFLWCCTCGRDPRDRKRRPDAREAGRACQNYLAAIPWKDAMDAIMEGA